MGRQTGNHGETPSPLDAWSSVGEALRTWRSLTTPPVASVAGDILIGLAHAETDLHVRSCGEQHTRPYADTSSGSRRLRLFCSFGQRDLLAAFEEEPHKRQEQHKF